MNQCRRLDWPWLRKDKIEVLPEGRVNSVNTYKRWKSQFGLYKKNYNQSSPDRVACTVVGVQFAVQLLNQIEKITKGDGYLSQNVAELIPYILLPLAFHLISNFTSDSF